MDRGRYSAQSTGTKPNHSEPAQTEVITKQPERITLEPTEIANVPAETQEITGR
jgi:hypothetical protein